MSDLSSRLTALVRQSDALMAMLCAVRDLGLPQAYIGAGAVRSLVWDHLSGFAAGRSPPDIDVVYFDAHDLTAQREAAYQAALCASLPGQPWEVSNQARVHLWYAAAFGQPVAPLRSMHEAVASWPEYATCVAVRLQAGGALEILAPYGLADLFAMVVRHNPQRVSAALYQRRLATKRYAERWPGVRIFPAEGQGGER